MREIWWPIGWCLKIAQRLVYYSVNIKQQNHAQKDWLYQNVIKTILIDSILTKYWYGNHSDSKKILNVTEKPLQKLNLSNGFKVNQTRPYLYRLDLSLQIKTISVKAKSPLKPFFPDMVKKRIFSQLNTPFLTDE